MLQTEAFRGFGLTFHPPSTATNNPDRVESVPFHIQTSAATVASKLALLSQQLSGFQQQFSQQLSGFEQRITSKIDDVKDRNTNKA